MFQPFWILLFFGASLRLIVWWSHGQDVFQVPIDRVLWSKDCYGLLNDPLRAFAWEHTRPPLLLLMKVFQCSLWPAIDPRQLNLILVSGADVFATSAVYFVFRRLSIDSRLAFFSVMVWSVALISWEYYRWASNHNHLNIALFSFFIHAAIVRFQDRCRRSDLYFAGTGAVLMSNFGLAVIIVPLLGILLAPWVLGIKRVVSSTLVAISLPAAIWVGVSFKNYAAFDTFSMSTYVSYNMTQYAFISLGYDRPDKYLTQLLPELRPSRWWSWCYEQHRKTNETPAGALEALQGQCLNFKDPNSVKAGLSAAESFGEELFIKPLRTDLAVARSEPWLLRIGSPDTMTSNTEVVFIDTSKRLYGLLLKTDPLALVRTFLMANRSFFIWGPMMFDGVHHEPQHVRGPPIINWLATGLGILMILGVAFGGVIIVKQVWRIIVVFRRGGFRALPPEPTAEHFVAACLATVFVAATIFNVIVCCENGRQFQSLSTVPLVLAIFMLNGCLRQIAGRSLEAGKG